ncbi:DNA repair protein [Segatella asaccharophila]
MKKKDSIREVFPLDRPSNFLPNHPQSKKENKGPQETASCQPSDKDKQKDLTPTKRISARLSIKEWATEDRPREKLERLGPAALSNAELLAILIGSGTPSLSAVDLMKTVLKAYHNNLNSLGKAEIHELVTRFKGIGPAKAITILAACELGKRRQLEKAEERQELGSATAVYNYMHPRMQDLDVEEAWILLLNQNYKLIKAESISHGGITETAVDIRVIMREALLHHATILGLCHNHPSNNATPSCEDDRLTLRMKKACSLMRIFFMDHVIICDGQYYSYREMGRL